MLSVAWQFYPLPFPYGDNQQIWNRERGASADDWVIVDVREALAPHIALSQRMHFVGTDSPVAITRHWQHVRAPAVVGKYVLR